MVPLILLLQGLGAPSISTPLRLAQMDARQAAAVRKACAVGALPADQCSGQGRSRGEGAASPGETASHGGFAAPGADGHRFSDPRGRYSLAVPRGWTLQMQGDAASLSNGPSWIQIVADSAPSAQAVLQKVGASFVPAFSRTQVTSQGDAQLGGHAAFGANIDATSTKGEHMSVMMIAESAGGGHYLVIVSATPAEQASQLNPAIMALANSVRFNGE